MSVIGRGELHIRRIIGRKGVTSQKLLGGREVKPNPFLLQFAEFCCFTASHFCMASMQNTASTSIFNSSQQGK